MILYYSTKPKVGRIFNADHFPRFYSRDIQNWSSHNRLMVSVMVPRKNQDYKTININKLNENSIPAGTL